MAKIFTIAESVKELKGLLAAGTVPEIGQIALSMNGMDWRCIEHTEENGVVLMMAAAYDWRPFSRPDKAHPWGWNNYEASQIRRELNSEVLEDLFGDEKEMLERGNEWGDRLYLLSEEEAGYRQTDKTFAYFWGKDEDALDERRRMKDKDGDPCVWWLRSPYPGYAYNVRLVGADGSLRSNTACSGYGAVAACIITAS